ncbi:DNA cytosine methyltransferase [Campylobacter upsaliensis]|uniref:DNA cytosine methyltransferase n=1 Tax=Campylobacter upsaliensis TaxID=28080 RepID=UPI0022EAEBC3|nr:DNA (cytosine-5-)-methyltransferase [Campylobacter upsaliensis]
MKKYHCIDSFSGAGGFSLGFLKSGFFDILLSIDNNPNLSITYEKNFTKIKHLNQDILSFDDENIRKLQKKHHFEVIIGGPPCQGFSLAGQIGRKELQDDRNQLFLAYLKFIKIIKPRIFIMENVATLAKHNKGQTLKDILKCFNDVGYDVKYEILNAKDYEIAQNRSRIFIVGTANDNTFSFPPKSNLLKNIKEAIDDLPPLMSGENSNIPNHKAMSHSKQMLEKMSHIKDGGNREQIPAPIRPKSGDIRKYIRYHSAKPSITITADMRKVFHYSQNRALTARELARIQSFPDDFIFYGNSIDIQQQIGNAVPPLLAQKIANQVKIFLDETISKS